MQFFHSNCRGSAKAFANHINTLTEGWFKLIKVNDFKAD